MKTITGAVFAFLLCFTALCHGQVDVSRFEIGARQLGMGSAAVGDASDINALFWNPAGLVQLNGSYLATQRQLFYRPLNFPYDYIAYAKKLSSGDAYGVYLSRFDASSEALYTWKEDKYFFSYAYDFEDEEGLSVGLNLKYLRTVIKWDDGSGSGNGYGADLGILYRLSPQFKVGVMARDVYTLMSWSTGTDENFPQQYILGLSYEGKHDMLVAVDAEYDTHQSVPAPFKLHIGAERWLDEVIALRLGYVMSQAKDESTPTAGIGVHLGPWEVDYAYIHKTTSAAGIDPGHRISAIFKLH